MKLCERWHEELPLCVLGECNQVQAVAPRPWITMECRESLEALAADNFGRQSGLEDETSIWTLTLLVKHQFLAIYEA